MRLLNENNVEYLVIGGHAVAFHGYPRATNDLDIWIAIAPKNAQRVTTALLSFGFSAEEIQPSLFLSEKQVLRIGVIPNRIEILTGIDGIQFADCFPRRISANLEGVQVWFIDLNDLKANKKASGRNKDLADLDELP